MNTPIYDFVESYAGSQMSRMHMPGHKGKTFLGCEKSDITEIDGADVLYHPDGIIAQSEDNATALWGSAHTYYSTQGSSLCISAMLSLVSMQCASGKPHILAARNVHKAFVHAAALLDADVSWVYPKDHRTHICSAKVCADDIEKAIENAHQKIDAVYITSPDYLGVISDIKSISAVCRKHSILLLVDNAHGAYLAFCKENLHPIHSGADMCCDSAHKTLPVLTGGAYLHISKQSPSFCKDARRALSLFASTSPSYLILQSLDLCNDYLENRFVSQLEDCIAKTKNLKLHIQACGFFVAESEDLKIVVDAKKSGFSGNALADFIRNYGVECEFSDDDYVVFMTSPQNDENDFERLSNAFLQIKPGPPVDPEILPAHTPHRQALSIRQAVLSNHERMDIKNAYGRICALPLVSCPPAVPFIISGEVITENDIRLFEKYGIDEIEVVASESTVKQLQ